MKPHRTVLRRALTLALFLAVGSCGADREPVGITPPADSVQPDYFLGRLVRHLGLLTCDPLPEATASETIGPAGGILEVGPHRLFVPAGALDHAVTITAVAPSDTVNTVRFEPHGLHFERSAYLQMSYANCDLLYRWLPKRIAYTTDLLDILSFLSSWDNPLRQRVTGRLDHFSQYAVSW